MDRQIRMVLWYDNGSYVAQAIDVTNPETVVPQAPSRPNGPSAIYTLDVFIRESKPTVISVTGESDIDPFRKQPK